MGWAVDSSHPIQCSQGPHSHCTANEVQRGRWPTQGHTAVWLELEPTSSITGPAACEAAPASGTAQHWGRAAKPSHTPPLQLGLGAGPCRQGCPPELLRQCQGRSTGRVCLRRSHGSILCIKWGWWEGELHGAATTGSSPSPWASDCLAPPTALSDPER